MRAERVVLRDSALEVLVLRSWVISRGPQVKVNLFPAGNQEGAAVASTE